MEDLRFLRGRRLRMFAGPNGSGKSTIFTRIDDQFSMGYYINPDLLDKGLKEKGYIKLSDYGLKNNLDTKFNNLLDSHSIAIKAKKEKYPINLTCSKGIILQNNGRVNSYNSAFISDFLRNELVSVGKKLSCETVMSHKSKLDFLTYAAKNGYKNYLYFISTASPEINIERIKLRVKNHGHDVENKRVVSRYFNTMNLLYDAVLRCYRTFIFDNSGKDAKLICEINHQNKINYFSTDIPYWVYKHLIAKFVDTNTRNLL